MKKFFFSMVIAILLAINYSMAADFVLATFDSTNPEPMVFAKWPTTQVFWQGGAITSYDIVANPQTGGYNKTPFCMGVGQAANADWWGNFSGIALPDITVYADSCKGRGILVTAEQPYLKMFVLRDVNVRPFSVRIGTTEHPSNATNDNGIGSNAALQAFQDALPDAKVGQWCDIVMDLTPIIGQHLRSVGIINTCNWSSDGIATPVTTFYYDNFVMSDNPTPRDTYIPPLKANSNGFYIGFENTVADAFWYTNVAAPDELSSYSIADNIPNNVNQTDKVLEYAKSASAAVSQSGPVFTLNGGMPIATNKYLHVFVKAPAGAIDPNTGYCLVQLTAKDWQVDTGATTELKISKPDVWQDIVLDLSVPDAAARAMQYITNFALRFDVRYNQFGKPTVSPENIFYVDGIVLNNSAEPRTLLGSQKDKNGDIVLANFDNTNQEQMLFAKWADTKVFWQGGAITTYAVAANPQTDGYNKTPFCMAVGQAANADWWGNFSGIAIPGITVYADSCKGRGILVTAENPYLKMFVLRDVNVRPFSVRIGTTEHPSNQPNDNGIGGNAAMEAFNAALPDAKVGQWCDIVMDLTPIIGQHLRSVGIINTCNWSSDGIATPVTTFYYDNFVMSNNPTPRDTYIPPLKANSNGFYIGFENTVADAFWYTNVAAPDELSSYSITDNIPDDVNQTDKVLEYAKSASAAAAQSGPVFTLNGGMPIATNKYLHVFVKAPTGAIDPNTGYCLVQLTAKDWQVDTGATTELEISEPDVWQDIVLDLSVPDAAARAMQYITNFALQFDVRYNQFGKPTVSPENTFYVDGIVLNNSAEPRTLLGSQKDANGDIVLANFDNTNQEQMLFAKWADTKVFWQGGAITTYAVAANPQTDGYNKTPFCMAVGQVANADWWGNFSGITIPGITVYADSCKGRGILVTAENPYLKMFVLRDVNVRPFSVRIGTTEHPSNQPNDNGIGGNAAMEAFNAALPDAKVGKWCDIVMNLTPIIGQHLRSVGIINTCNWSSDGIATPVTTFYYDNFVMSNNANPRDTYIPPFKESSDGFYIGFEDPVADAEWYSEVVPQDVLSSYSIVDNTPDNVNYTTQVMQYDKSASATANQSGPLFTLNGSMPVTTNKYLHVFVKVPETAINPTTGYCMVQLIAKDWQVDNGVIIEEPIFTPNVWQDIVLDVTSTGKEYITELMLQFDVRMNQFGKPTVSPEGTFYLDGIELNTSAEPRATLGTAFNNVKADRLTATNSGKNIVTVTTANDAKISILNSIGQTVAAGQIKGGVAQSFNVGNSGVYIVVANTGASKKLVKVLVL